MCWQGALDRPVLSGPASWALTAILCLRMAATGKVWFVPVALGYVGAFVCVSITLRHGLAFGVAYGIWAAAGVAFSALASRLLLDEPLTAPMGRESA